MLTSLVLVKIIFILKSRVFNLIRNKIYFIYFDLGHYTVKNRSNKTFFKKIRLAVLNFKKSQAKLSKFKYYEISKSSWDVSFFAFFFTGFLVGISAIEKFSSACLIFLVLGFLIFLTTMSSVCNLLSLIRFE